MSTYQGDERRDQSERGLDLREVVGVAMKFIALGGAWLDPKNLAYQVASMAWRRGFERGRSAGAKEVMEHVESELGALREGLKED